MYFDEVDIDQIGKYLQSNIAENSACMILLSEEDIFSATSLIDLMNLRKIEFSGGIFPALIYNDELKKSGVIIKKISTTGKSFVFEDLKSISTEIDKVEKYVSEKKPKLVYLFMNGLSVDINDFLAALYKHLGTSVSYFGAGCGTSDLISKPTVFSNQGLLQDGVALLFCDEAIESSLNHGFKPMNEPYLVTKSSKNKVTSLNWQDAYEVYHDAVGKSVNHKKENFKQWASSFPIGIYRNEGELLIREPIIANHDNEIIFVGNVNDNALVYVLYGDKSALKEAAAKATENIFKGTNQISDLFVLECNSRLQFLKEDSFLEELEIINRILVNQSKNANMFGALALGEIASLSNGILEFYTKSVLIGGIHEKEK